MIAQWRCRHPGCNELLNTTSDVATGEIVAWHHALPRDHDADPTPDIESTKPPMLACDFCGARLLGDAWRYPCRAMNHDGTNGETITATLGMVNAAGDTKTIQVVESNPDFIACAPCHDLIKRDDRVALATRSVISYIQAHDLRQNMHEEVVLSISMVHQQFWESRDGEPVKL